MTERVKVGTRRSPLALVQTDQVVRRLARRFPEMRFLPVPIVTSGDRETAAGGSPDFTDAIDLALSRGEIDLAVHSAKDVESSLPAGLRLAAFLRRADPRDCLVARRGVSAGRLPKGARVGSSSVRRRAQLLRHRPDLIVEEVRGNVDTRLRLVRDGSVDAVVLAVAGLARLHRTRSIGRILPIREYLPAPGQGALVVAVRDGNGPVERVAATLEHPATRAAVLAERSFSAELGGDCRSPLAALGTVRGATLSLVGEVLAPDGRRSVRGVRRGPTRNAEALGRSLGRAVLEAGGDEILAASR